MNRYLAPICSVLLFAGWIAIEANAQTPAEMTKTHVAAAKAATYRPGFDFTNVFDSTCPAPGQPSESLTVGRVYLPPSMDLDDRSTWFVESVKVFDNLYYIGSLGDSIWAVTTSEGIILVNTGSSGVIKDLATEGLRKFGLNPADIRYVIATHAHSAIYPGAKHLQETYNARIIMSEADWDIMARNDDPAGYKSRKDMIATDGMKLTLGDTTLTIYITPGHTTGTLSLLIPLKDGNQTHLGSLVGGQGWGVGRSGVQYWADETEAISVWGASLKRWRDITAQAGADVYLALHPQHVKLFVKLYGLNFRRPGIDPHPFVNRQAVQNHATIIAECMDAQLALRSSSASN
jgi:metallo-beta-lactamase class B